MIEINSNELSQILVDGIFDNELDKNLRETILGDVPSEHYELACRVFHDTRKSYFQLGFTLFKQ